MKVSAYDIPGPCPRKQVNKIELKHAEDDASYRALPVPYLERYKAFSENHVCNQIEALLTTTGDNRVSRRRFKRLIEKNWPLSPDEKRHPRTLEFVRRYTDMIEKAKVAL